MPAHRRALSLIGLLIALTCAATGTVAHASPIQYSVMMDDNRLVYGGDKTRDKTLFAMRALGVDYVRVTVEWKYVALGARSTPARARRFRRLGADNPKAYPKLNWNRWDGLVRTAQALGIGVYFDVTGPGPSWGHEKAPHSERSNQATWMPKARQFKLFVEAVGRRYSGRYRDEDTGHTKLPRVSFWSLWNEPNQGGWLTPQWYHGKAYSPMMFRRLYLAGRQGLLATGHGKDVVLLGETAPLGSSGRTERSPMYPKTFLENLFCVDSGGKPTARDLGCSDFDKTPSLQATAYAHHPYTKHNAPLQRDASPLAFTMANISDLENFLDLVAVNSGRVAKTLGIALTEYGYETNPPDRFQGISPAKQAEYSNLGDLLSWADPRVITQTQYLLRDVGPLKNFRKGTKHYWFTYQSGLQYASGRPKPALNAYRMPFEALPYQRAADGRLQYVFWGQLRFRPNYAVDHVVLQFKARGSRRWVALGPPLTTTTRNYFDAFAEVPGPGQLRATWGGTDAPYIASSRIVAAK